MLNNKVPLSVIIPTMNRPQALKRTINGLLSFSNIPDQIIVVDQSEDIKNQNLNREVLNLYSDTITTTYLYQKTPSITEARNLGLHSCNNDIVVFSDDDVDVNCDTLYEIYRLMSNKNIAMIAGIDENKAISKSKLGYIFGIKSYKKRKIGQVALSMHGSYPNEITGLVNTEWAMGYFFVVRKSFIDKWVIKWDETLTSYSYAEDLDFTYSYYKRAKKENLKCVLSDTVKVKHLVSKEWRVASYKSSLMYVINREYLSYKHFKSPLSRIATRWANLGEFFNRIIKRNHPMYIVKAQYFCDKYRSDIKKGNIHTELFK